MISLLQESCTFAIHLLSESMQSHSMAFANPSTQAKFDEFSHTFLPIQNQKNIKLPILKGSIGVLICRMERQISIGDHDVFFGTIDDLLHEDHWEALRPLLYYKSTYRSIGDQIFMEQFESGQLESWKHREHLRMGWTYVRDAGTVEEALPLIRLF